MLSVQASSTGSTIALMAVLALVGGCTSFRYVPLDGGDLSADSASPSADTVQSGSAGGGPGVAGTDGKGGSGGVAGTTGLAGAGGAGTGGQINTQTDGKNCGAVGHDCLGGQCLSGQCQPVLIAQYLGEPLSMAVGPTVACETNTSGQIGCARKDGSDLRPFAYPEQTAMAFLGARSSVDGNRLIFSQLIIGGGFQIAACDIGSCESTAQPLGAPYTQYAAVDIIAHRVYWIDGTTIVYGPTVGIPQQTGLAFNANGGTLGPPMLYSRNNILFTSHTASGYTIFRIPISALGSATTAVPIGAGQASVTNDQAVFWDDVDGIRSIPLPNGLGGGSSLILAGVTAAMLAVDQLSLYWTASPGLQTCLIANCAATRKTLPPGPSAATDRPFTTQDVSVDDTAVFWVVETSGAGPDGQVRNSAKIFKLAK